MKNQSSVHPIQLSDLLRQLLKVEDRSNIIPLLFDKINEFFKIDDLGLFEVLEDGRHRDFAVDNYPFDQVAKELNKNNVTGFMPPHKGITWLKRKTEIVSIEDFAKVIKGHPHLDFVLKSELKEFISTPLIYENREFGLLFLWSNKKGRFSKKDLNLAKEIAEVVSIVLNNIIEREQILANERQKSQLLAISQKLSTIKTLPDFLEYVMNELKDVFRFDDVGIVLIENGKYQDLTVRFPTISPSERNHNLSSVLGDEWFTYKDSFIEWGVKDLQKNGSPKIYAVDEIKEWYGYEQQKAIEESGLQVSVVTLLEFQGELMGLFSINSNERNYFKPEQLEFFGEVGKQLAVCLNSILSTQRLQEEKAFKETLLSITESVSKIRTLPDFLKFTLEKLKPIFKFHDVGIFLLTEDKEQHYDLAAMEPGISPSIWNEALADTGVTLVKHKGSVVEFMMQQIRNNDNVYLFDFKQLNKKFPDYYQVAVLESLSLEYRDCLASNFKIGSEALGMFCINSSEKDFFLKEIFPLFKSITEQLSIAVSNILNTESIVREREFSNSLLNITQHLVSVTDAKKLYKVIFENIKPIFPYDELGLFVFDEDKEYHYELIDGTIYDNPVSQYLIEEKFGAHNRYKHKDTSVAWLMNNGPITITMEELDKIASHPQHQYMIEGGLKQFIGGPLVIGGIKIGMFCFTSKQKDLWSQKDIPLFSNILEQLSVVVSNILATEAILLEKEQKQRLLNVSNALTTVTDEDELYKVIFRSIRPLIDYDELGVFVLDKSGKYHYELNDTETIENRVSQHMVEAEFGKNALYEHSGTSVAWLMENGPIILAMEELHKKAPHPQHQLMMEAGIQQIIAGPLTYAGENIGMLNFTSTTANKWSTKYLSLFQALSEQISVVVSNILAKEAILLEKEQKQRLLNVSKALATVTTEDKLYKIIFNAIKPIFNYDELGIFVLNETGQFHYELTDENLFDKSVAQHLIEEKFGANALYTHKDSSVEWVIKNGPIIEELETLNKQTSHPQLQIMVDAGLRQIIAGPLIYAGKEIGMLNFTSTDKNRWSEKDLPMFNAISEQISVVVSNILATKTIIKEKEFNQKLLAVSEALATANTNELLYGVIDKTIRPVLPYDDLGIFTLDDTGKFFYKLAYSTLLDKNYIDNTVGFNKASAQNERQKNFGAFVLQNGLFVSDVANIPAKAQTAFKKLTADKTLLQTIAAPLIYGDNAFGFIFFASAKANVYAKNDISFFQTITEQISVAVANILNRKRIVLKNELQAFELRASQEIEKDTELRDKWQFMLSHLAAFLPFNFVVIKNTNEEELLPFDRLGKNKLRYLDDTAMKAIFGVSKNDTNQWLENIGFQQKENAFLNLTENKITGFKKFKTSLCYRFKSNNKESDFQLFLFHTDTDAYTVKHIDILDSISNTLVISFDNWCANQEIKHLTEQLLSEKTYLESLVREAYNFSDIVGESKAMQTVFDKIKEVSSVDATVLLLGETGTGKELIARAIHENSDRKDRVLVKVNCAAIPSQIVESELFGHERGAFTGAVGKRIGKFELANGGTIFLDEIGEMPLELQAKLLRVLQEREVERLGSNTTIKLDIRIIAATNRILSQEIKNGNFREDLYYRLNGYPIEVPPLTVRGEDVLLLAEFFAKQFTERYGLPFKGLTKDTKIRFLKYTWPGNVRELQNLIEQAVISQKGKVLQIYPGNSNLQMTQRMPQGKSPQGIIQNVDIEELDMEGIKKIIAEVERKYLLEILENHKWKVSGKNGAARKLGIQPTTLEYRMKRLGISRN